MGYQIKIEKSFSFDASHQEYRVKIWASMPVDEDGKIPEILRAKSQFFGDTLSSVWGYRDEEENIRRDYVAKTFASLDEAKNWADNYISEQIALLRQALAENQDKINALPQPETLVFYV